MSTRSFSPLVVVLTVPAVVFGPLLACGGDSKGKPDARIVVVDSRPIDATAPCLATASYGTPSFGSNQFANAYGVTGGSGSASHVLYYGGVLNNDPLFDALDIELYAGYGVFTGGDYSAKSNINLGTENADYATCGACVLIYADFNRNAGSGVDPVSQYYLATGGTLNLTNVGSGSGSGQFFTGSMSGATFTHVTIDPMTLKSTVVPGCTSAITSATFNGPLKVHFVGKDTPPILGHRHR